MSIRGGTVFFKTTLLLIIAALSFQKCSTGSNQEVYDTREQHEAREREINTLVAKPSAENLKKLLPYLRSGNKNDRMVAANALHHFAEYLDRELPDIEKALSDPEWRVRAGTLAAVYYMREKGQPLLPLVRNLVSDPHESVSTNAFTALDAISGGKEGGCALTEQSAGTVVHVAPPKIPPNKALIFGNIGCAYTNDAVKLVKKMKLQYEVFDLYRNSENTNLLHAYLHQFKIRKYETIPIVIYRNRVFEKPRKDGDIQ